MILISYVHFLILISLFKSRFIYVPAPHTAEVIGEELYESLVEWNLNEKLSAMTLDNCTTNDAVIPYLVRNIGKDMLLNDGKLLIWLFYSYS
jgi:hypothetical protein